MDMLKINQQQFIYSQPQIGITWLLSRWQRVEKKQITMKTSLLDIDFLFLRDTDSRKGAIVPVLRSRSSTLSAPSRFLADKKFFRKFYNYFSFYAREINFKYR